MTKKKTAKKKAAKKKATRKRSRVKSSPGEPPRPRPKPKPRPKPAGNKLDPDQAATVTGNAAAVGKLLGLSRDAIFKHIRENQAPGGDNGQIPIAEFITWYAGRLKDSSDVVRVERQKLVQAQRKKAELEVSIKRGDLYGRDLVNEAVMQIASMISTGLDSLPARVAGQAVAITDTATMQDYLLNETRAIRGELSRSVESFASDIRGGSDTRAAADN